ncbi:glyoxylate/hydroxypyruvate reductase hpr3, partial [Phtheirospermum japonicum]
KRVGIVGLGSIGFEVAKRLEAFGCAISYHSRNEKPYVSYVFYPDIHKLAGVIVNIARGAVVDEKELPWVPKELYELDNVVLSPHAGVFTEESFGDLFELVCGEFGSFL